MIKKDWEEWVEELNDILTNWLEKETKFNGSGDRICKRCGSLIMKRMVYGPIHEYYSLMKSHGGSGKVHTFVVPECKKEGCENHTPSFWSHGLHDDKGTLRAPCIDY